MITNNHVIDEKILEKEKNILISINKKNKEIKLENRKVYTNKDYDTTIIEIKNKDGIDNYLEVDDNILENISNISYIKKSIYIIQYEGKEEEASVSYGILKNIDESNNYTFEHLCSTEKGSSGSPILNIKNNKIIGIHKEAYKNNYNRGTFLNYPIQEYINNYLIEEFNEKYNVIVDNNILKLELTDKKIGDEGLKILSKMEFKKLKALVLYNNNISDIQVLEKAKFEKLEELNLGENNISDINILEEVTFKELKILCLNINNILNIQVLEKVKFEKLEELNLSENKIININVLTKVNFKKLKKLNLQSNNISDIQVLEKVKFE